MASASLLMLLDDIASTLDDVALLSKLAAKKTAGVLGDDLALNAQQVAGVQANRELPVVWAVAKGSLINKAILVPAALLISAFIPWLVTPLLMIGGAYLCYEGFEKLAHHFLHSKKEQSNEKRELVAALNDSSADLVAFEQGKVKGAIRTDFILSAEIIVISLGIVANEPLMMRISVLIAIALLMTVAVYGFVALIIKLDDAGVWLQQRKEAIYQFMGRFLLQAAPWLMRFLSFAGTTAMFLVGGGILVHGIPDITHWLEVFVQNINSGLLGAIVEMLVNATIGIAVGAVTLLVITMMKKIASLGQQSNTNH